MSKIMNGYFVAAMLAPFAGMSDEEREEAGKVAPNDEVAVKDLIEVVLKPNFGSYDDQSQTILKDNLSYFLTEGTNNWGAIYDMDLPPIDAPEDTRQFFVWLWEVLFPGEAYLMADVSGIKVSNDIDALSVLRGRKT